MPVSEQGRDALWLRALFALGLILRLVFVVKLHPARDYLFSDMQSYDYVALEMLSGRAEIWHAFRPVGYSMLLALIYPLTDVSRTFVGVLQALMGAALAPLSAQLARAAGASRVGAYLVGAAVATSLPLILYCGLVLTEIPSAFLLVLGLKRLMVVRDGARSPYGRLVVAGLYLGVAAAIRPNFLMLCPIVAFYLLRWGPVRRAGAGLEQAPPPRALWAGGVFGLGLVLPLLVVSLYNSLLLHKFAGPAANGGLNFYLNFADVHTIQYQGPYGQYWISPVPNGFDHTRQELTHVPLFEDRYYYARGLRVIRERPRVLLEALQNFPEAAGIGHQLLWPHWPGHELLLLRYARGFFALGLVPALISLVLLAIGAFRARRTPEPEGALRAAFAGNPQALTLGLICASTAIPIYLFLGDPRVRVPFDPLWLVLAVLLYEALVRLLTGWISRRRSP